MKQFLLLTFSLLLWANFCHADEEKPVHARVMEKLLQGIEGNNLEVYHSVCDAAMKKAVSAEDLDELNALLGEAMEMGYAPEYLGALDKGGRHMHVWRLNFVVEGIPDMLAVVVMNGNKAASLTVK